MKITRLQKVTTKQEQFNISGKNMNGITILCLAAFVLFHSFLNAQELNQISDSYSEKNYKSVSAAIGFGNSFLTKATPGYLLTFEKNGLLGSGLFGSALDIEKLFNTGFYAEYRNDFFNTLGFGLRASLDPLEFINQFANTTVNAASKLDVNVGGQWGYILFFDEWLGIYGGFRKFQPYLNARYYLTNSLGIHAELGRTATYTNINAGISLRY